MQATPTECTVGASVACTCTDGRTGAQICQPDHTLGACTCAGSTGTGGAPVLPPPIQRDAAGDVTATVDAVADTCGTVRGTCLLATVGLRALSHFGDGYAIFRAEWTETRIAWQELREDALAGRPLVPLDRTKISGMTFWLPRQDTDMWIAAIGVLASWPPG